MKRLILESPLRSLGTALLLAAVSASLAHALRDDESFEQLADPAPAVAIAPAVLAGLETYACASCHSEVAAEWAASAHGLAWVDEDYQASIAKKRRPQSCHGCHVPQPLLAGDVAQRPRPRKFGREFGVGCEACHVGPEEVVLGPRGTETEAHASAVSPYMSAPGSDALCSACHATNIGPVIGVAKDFEANDLAAEGYSCVGCHMATRTRRWADDEDTPERKGRSHALQTPRDPTFLRRAFEVAWSVEGGRSRVTISNRAGHRVPGLIGREIRFEAELLNASGAAIGSGSLTLDTDAYLPAKGTVSIALEGGSVPGGSVTLVGLHVDPRAEAPIEFLEEQLEAPPR